MWHLSGLHELDPVFRKVTLDNEKIKAVVRDLQFHHDPVGEWKDRTRSGIPNNLQFLALQSMVICKQPRIGGEGETLYPCLSVSDTQQSYSSRTQRLVSELLLRYMTLPFIILILLVRMSGRSW